MQHPGSVRRWETIKLTSNGNTIRVRETARGVEDSDGKLSLLSVCEDITAAHRLSVELSFQATHDGLTGLCNRPEFERRLKRVMETAHESDTDSALCYLDLDQFKIINDTCGHVAGDEL